jgi:hypothetical protein
VCASPSVFLRYDHVPAINLENAFRPLQDIHPSESVTLLQCRFDQRCLVLFVIVVEKIHVVFLYREFDHFAQRDARRLRPWNSKCSLPT